MVGRAVHAVGAAKDSLASSAAGAVQKVKDTAAGVAGK